VSDAPHRKYYNSLNRIEFLDLWDKAGIEDARQLATWLKVSESRVSRYYSGDREPPDDFLEMFRLKLDQKNSEQRRRGGVPTTDSHSASAGSSSTGRTETHKLRRPVKYPSTEDGAGSSTPIHDEVAAAKRQLEEISQHPDDFRTVKEFINYQHSKVRKKKKT
jgi:hypothetical protein